MQENELDVSKNLREENKRLRNDNDALRDEILELKHRLNESKKTGQTSNEYNNYLAPAKQNSGSNANAPSNSNASQPNYYPGMSQNFTEQPREKLSYQRDNSAPAPQQLAMER